MASDKLTLELDKRLDTEGKVYYIAKLTAPINIDCSKGVAFLIFTSNDGEEEMQISSITKPKDKDGR